MGNLCPCLKSSASVGAVAVEMSSKKAGGTRNGGDGKAGPSLTLSRRMSAQEVHLDEGMTRASGEGLALVGCSIEQDAAYWEWHIEGNVEDDLDVDEDDLPKFGVATKKDRQFYRAQEAGEIDDSAPSGGDGTVLMRPIHVFDGDTIGVAVQQSDLPMVQFLLNGEPLHELAINRFRGTVYPSVFVREGIAGRVVFDEDTFKELSPHARFGPLIAARGII